MTTVWNPADETGCVFSDTNHTISSTSAGNNGGRASPTGHSTGKWAIEFYNVSFPSGVGASMLGFGKTTDSIGGSGQFNVDAGGNLNSIGGGVHGSVAGSPWTAIGFYIDFDAGFFWVTLDGITYVGDGTAGADPNTGLHGRQLLGVSGPVFPMVTLQNIFGGSGAASINAGDRTFSFPLPTDFTKWDSPPPPFSYLQSRILA